MTAGAFSPAFRPDYGTGVDTPAAPVFTEPDTSPFTDRVYGELPVAYRDADALIDYPLKRWLSLLGDQGGEVEALLDRVALTRPEDGRTATDVSDLVNPETADLTWLPWLGQLVGVRLPANVQGQAARDAIRSAASGFQAGTKAAIATAARSALTGSQHVSVHDHSITSPGDGGQWDVLLVTAGSETPSSSAVLAAVTSKRAKPAGVVLHHRAYSASWAQLTSAYPTWASRSGKTWRQLQETGL